MCSVANFMDDLADAAKLPHPSAYFPEANSHVFTNDFGPLLQGADGSIEAKGDGTRVL